MSPPRGRVFVCFYQEDLLTAALTHNLSQPSFHTGEIFQDHIQWLDGSEFTPGWHIR